jgi:hypothetical protein
MLIVNCGKIGNGVDQDTLRCCDECWMKLCNGRRPGYAAMLRRVLDETVCRCDDVVFLEEHTLGNWDRV